MNNIESIIEKILWSKSLAEVKDCNNISRLFILRSLTIKESNLAQFIYDKEYEESINNGIFTFDELKKSYFDSGVWTDKDDNEIENIKKSIRIIKSKIKAYEFFISKKRQLERQLKEEEKKISEKTLEKFSLFSITAESRAEEIKRRYIVMMSTETEHEEKFWPTINDFMNETDFELIYNLAIAYNKYNLFDEQTLRKVARSPMWRYRWAAAKIGADLFGKPISEWSEMQNMLVYWSQYYDSIYESLEQPVSAIIEDDAACDAWVIEQSKKNNNSGSNKINIFGTKKAKTKKPHQEQFIMTGGDRETIQKIQDINTNSVKQQLNHEHEIIKKKGKVSEWQLRRGMYAK